MTTLEDMLRKIVREELRAELDARATATPKQITAAAYAELHGISLTTVRVAIREGRLPAVRIGRAVRVPADAVIGKPVRAKPLMIEGPSALAQQADRILKIVDGRK